MKLFHFKVNDNIKENEEVYNRKIKVSNLIKKSKTTNKRKTYVRKFGRIVEILFPCEVRMYGKINGLIQLTESEVFLLANICRANRTDSELIEAIENAGLDVKGKQGREIETL